MAGGPPVAHTEDDGLSEADGVHDGLDLGRSIIQRANFRDRVRQPDPGLVEQDDATERGELVEEGLEFGHGPEQLDVADHRPDEDQLDRPVAEHLIRQAEIAAGCVRRFRHGMSVLLPGASPAVSTASPARTYDDTLLVCADRRVRQVGQAMTSAGSPCTSAQG